MMSRSLAMLAALFLLVSPCSAKVAVVVERLRNSTVANAPASWSESKVIQNQSAEHVIGFLGRYGRTIGVDYDVFTTEQMKTEWARTGIINGVAYSAVIWAGFEYQTTANNPHTTCYPCSLTLVGRAGAADSSSLPLVPQLFVGATTGEQAFATQVACSTGFGGDVFDPGVQGPAHSGGILNLLGTDYIWRKAYSQQGRTSHVPVGGFRVIVGLTESRESVIGAGFRDLRMPKSFFNGGSAAGTVDTTFAFGAAVVMRQNKHRTNVTYSPNIFVAWQNASVTALANSTHTNGDPFQIYLAMALLDSVCNGCVLGSTDPEPVRFAIQLDGACARRAWTATGLGGFPPGDTATVYTSIDSLDALRVPIAVGVNVDSAGTYLRDIITLRGLRLAKFTPWARGGLDSTANSGSATNLLTRDIWGRWRIRQFARPVGTGASGAWAAADTAISNLGQRAMWRIDSIFGVGRRSGIAMCPDEDWSPKNMTYTSGDLDSLVYAWRTAGGNGIAINVESDTLNTMGSANPVGLLAEPGFVNVVYGDKDPFGFIGYTRLLADTTDFDGGNTTLNTQHAIRRLWMSQFTGRWAPMQETGLGRTVVDWADPTYDVWTEGKVSPLANVERPVNILRISMSDLGSMGRPDRRAGFYAVKYLRNMVYALNQVAGRNLAQIVYPDELGPTDLR